MSLHVPSLYRAHALACALFLALIRAAVGQDITAIWNGGEGNWSDASRWSTNPSFPSNGMDVYSVTIQSGSVKLDRPIEINELTVGSYAVSALPQLDLSTNRLTVDSLKLASLSTITGSDILTVNGALEWNEALMLGMGTTEAMSGIIFNERMNSGAWFGRLDRTLNVHGTSSVQIRSSYSVNLDFEENAVLNIMPDATFNGSHLYIMGSTTAGIAAGKVVNYGGLTVDDPGVNRGMGVFGTLFINEGTIEITGSMLDIRSTSNVPGFTQNSGSVHLTGGTLSVAGVAVFEGGSLGGNGYVSNVKSNALITPTASGLNFQQGTLTLLPQSVLSFTIEMDQGTRKARCSQITNVSTTSLGGTLQIVLAGEVSRNIRPSDTFTLLSSGAITGGFTNVPSGARLFTSDNRSSFIVTNDETSVRLSKFVRSSHKRHP